MKNIIYLLLAFLIWGCEKEDKLTPKIEFENLYGIQDDPSDPIKHRVFEIYQKYRVPVYFNDTIGRIFLKNDVNGNAVYRYETLDLAWNYSSYDGVTYEYEYMTDPEEQTKALDIIESYLKLVPPALYPFNFFVTESAKMIDANNIEKIYAYGSFLNRYRTLFITGNWSEAQIAILPEKIKLAILESKIFNYREELDNFYEISEPSWYDRKWADLESDYNDIVNGTGKPAYYFSPEALSDGWWGVSEFSPEELAEYRAVVRSVIGKFGFVYGYKNAPGLYTPSSTSEDLETFITEVLRWSREEFKELWGACPLVMAKYEILYDVITNKIGVEL